MINGKIQIIHASNVDLEVHKESSVYASPGMFYILPDTCSLYSMARSIRQAEYEKNEWIRKYENLLKGLNYWKEKALSK